MHKDPVKRKERLYSLIGLIVGIGLLVGGIIGVIASRIDANEYANTDDIQKVEAVIEEISSKDEKDDDNMITGTDYRTKLSFVVDGKTFYGNYDFYASARDYEKKAAYDQLKATPFLLRYIRPQMENTNYRRTTTPSSSFFIVRQFPSVLL